jgi:hypothetical protein
VYWEEKTVLAFYGGVRDEQFIYSSGINDNQNSMLERSLARNLIMHYDLDNYRIISGKYDLVKRIEEIRKNAKGKHTRILDSVGNPASL